MKTIAELLLHCTWQLQQAGVDESARLDTELLLAHALGKPRSYLFAYPEVIVGHRPRDVFLELLARRCKGQPIAYLTGRREFWSLDLYVDERVLIPGPDTENLVAAILELPLADNACLIDLGTGSGAIAVSLAQERPGWSIVASDYSEQALQVARKNAQQYCPQNKCSVASNDSGLLLMQGDWLQAIAAHSLDLVVSNPPYIDQADPHLQQGDVRFEPATALISPRHGLADIDAIACQARSVLKPAAYLMVEHGWQQQQQVADIFRQQGYRNISAGRDLAGHPRFTVAQSFKPVSQRRFRRR